MGTRPDEVASRLRVYESCRYERAHLIQQFTRLAGKDLDDPEKADSELLPPQMVIAIANTWEKWSNLPTIILGTMSLITLPKYLMNGDTLKTQTFTGGCPCRLDLCLVPARHFTLIYLKERSILSLRQHQSSSKLLGLFSRIYFPLSRFLSSRQEQ